MSTLNHTKKTVLLILVISLSLLTPVFAKKNDPYVAKMVYRFDAKPPWAGKQDKNEATVEILNIPDGETVYGSVMVIAEAKGAAQVLLNGFPMEEVDYGDRYYGLWNSLGDSVIEVVAKDEAGETIASDIVTVNVVTEYQCTVYLEIDYMVGHEPSEIAKNYLKTYWSGFGVDIVYIDGNPVSDPTSEDGYISSNDFWLLEKENNGDAFFDDQASDGFDSDGYGSDGEYMSPAKWILWGTWDDNSNVGGYTYVVIENRDGVAGNYIFIADAMIDGWEASNGMTRDNGEVIVVCHEIGHSLGILQLRGKSEKYDSDYYSIMSTMHIENALYMEDAWYYSSTYWATKNLEYYK